MLNRVTDYLPVGLSPPVSASSGKQPAANAPAFSLRKAVEPVEQLVKNHPGAALAAAFIVGVTVAWWIKRR